jgi:hypothetical protein
MKTKLYFLILVSFIFGLSRAQVPQGFNYQAVARDASGASIVNTEMPVRITIQEDSLGGQVFWKELHPSVITNTYGLINIIVGKGEKLPESTVKDFSSIDWSVTPKYIMTEIFYNEWKNMGSSRLWSVPYAMVAGDLEGPVGKLSVKGGTTTGLEDALFEVKNKDGQTVFAVYNEGVRVYVSDGNKGTKGGFAVGGFGSDKAESQKYFIITKDSARLYLDTNPLTKGTKGGFAVGGYDLTKGSVQNYFDVSADSIRLYINDQGKGTKGGFAVGGFDNTKGINANFLNVATDAGGIINPSQNRILWYPLQDKNAFLVGRVLIHHPDSIGVNSVTTGYESRAKGMYSQALGYQSIARGDFSTAIGNKAVAHKVNSFAFGNMARAMADDSYALGTGAKATGNKSFALGSVGVDTLGNPTGPTIASAEAAFALGFGSVSSGIGSFTFGVMDTASGLFSQALGYLTRSQGLFSTTMGAGTTVESEGWNATAAGILTRAGNWAAFALGDQTYASGHTSFATGYRTLASGQLSATFGAQNTASGIGSVATGYNTIASGYGAISMGENTVAQPYASLVLGRYNLISGTPDFWFDWEPALVIGNGTSPSSRSNAMTVYKNGIADFGGYINLNRNSTYGAVYVNSMQAVWYDGNYFSWGYDGLYNYFARPVTIGYSGSPSYMLYVQGAVYATGGWAGSDARWKKDIQPIHDILPGILKLNGVYYDWRVDEFPDMKFEDERQIGLIAQDLEKVFPELVRTDDKGYKAVSYEKLTVVLLEGLKEQQKQLNSALEENQQLRSEIQSLKEDVVKIKSLIGINP